MANQEHLEILKQGVEVWNVWRKANPDIVPDLFQADLSEVDLNGAKLESANLAGANLSGATLENISFDYAVFELADLSGAHLIEVDFFEAHLYEANLSRTSFYNTSFYLANLTGANFSSANLQTADLHGANLTWSNFNGTDFSGVSINNTIFSDVDLSVAKGLDAIEHIGPSTIGIDTIYRSKGNIPEAFLKGAGVDDTFIEYIRSLIGKAIEYYSCFISYSSKDEAFARRLYADLQSQNVRCWFAPEDLKIGDKFRHRIDESIRIYDKLLLVLSEDSLASTWVSYEVEKGLDKEPEGVPNVLFPIRLDKAILTCETDWAKDIRKSRHIGDFERWKDHDAYQIAFERLLRDLKAQS